MPRNAGDFPRRGPAVVGREPGPDPLPGWYPGLLDSVSSHIAHGHRRAVRAANAELLATCWAVGREILDRQHEQGWGAKVVNRLSADLKARFPDARGYSPRNLQYMRALAAAWPDEAIVQRSAAQLPWRHHQLLLDKLDGLDQRRWYAAAATEHGWSRDVLALHIDAGLFRRAGRAISNFSTTLSAEDSDLVQQATRDPYLFDFLGTAQTRRERDLEQGLVDHVTQFLLELGQGFAFVGRQYRLEIGQREFHCDLLFYHLRLRRYVVIELKAVDFDPGFLSQLGLYIAAVDDLVAGPHDEPTLGLLLCRSKDNVVAEYALRSMAAPIGVAEWTEAITTSIPDDLSSTLPSIETLESELAIAPVPPEPGDE